MLEALRYHIRHLADFSGRDARQTFWYWFLACSSSTWWPVSS